MDYCLGGDFLGLEESLEPVEADVDEEAGLLPSLLAGELVVELEVLEELAAAESLLAALLYPSLR